MSEKSTPQGGQPSQSSGADKSQQSAARGESPRSLKDTTKLVDLTISELAALVSAEVSRAVGRIGVGASHVNSGPPGFVNGGGHANFDPRVTNPATSGVHVNSGPPGFVNGGVHANFDPRVTNPAISGVHVNSGPPGFVNGGGHANFDPRVTIPVSDISQIAGVAASHVNSGPPGFVNGGGHANFDPKRQPSEEVVLTLPDKTSVTVPATGPLNFRIGGFHITR